MTGEANAMVWRLEWGCSDGNRKTNSSWATSDGSAGKFTLDLLADPYWVGSAQPGGIGGRIFADVSTSVIGLTGCCAPGAAACRGISL
jgi:hypothetical protein